MIDRILWAAEAAGWRFDSGAVAPLKALLADDAAVLAGAPAMDLDERYLLLAGFPREVVCAYVEAVC